MSSQSGLSKLDSVEEVNSKIACVRTSVSLLNQTCQWVEIELSRPELDLGDLAIALEGMQKTAANLSSEILAIQESVEKVKCSKTSGQSGFRLLVVDDNATNRKVLAHLLSKRGHEVVEAENGKVACEIVKGGRIDGIFMDLAMPVLSGLEATIYMRETLKQSIDYLPIFAVSSYTMPETQDACIKVGMNGFIAKPIAASDIAAAIDIISQVRPNNLTAPLS